jgi:hypothetical protein
MSVSGLEMLCLYCGEILAQRPEYRHGPNRPSLGPLQATTTPRNTPVDEEGAVTDVPPRQPHQFTGTQTGVRQEAYYEAVTRLTEGMADHLHIPDGDRPAFRWRLRDWFESQDGVRLTQAVIDSRPQSSG